MRHGETPKSVPRAALQIIDTPDVAGDRAMVHGAADRIAPFGRYEGVEIGAGRPRQRIRLFAERFTGLPPSELGGQYVGCKGIVDFGYETRQPVTAFDFDSLSVTDVLQARGTAMQPDRRSAGPSSQRGDPAVLTVAEDAVLHADQRKR